MAVSGHYEGARAHVTTEWAISGEPLHTVISVLTGAIADKRHFVWSEGRLLSGQLVELSERAQQIVAMLTDGAISLTADVHGIELWDAAPIRDTDVAVKRLDQLLALAAALRGQQGPYR